MGKAIVLHRKDHGFYRRHQPKKKTNKNLKESRQMSSVVLK